MADNTGLFALVVTMGVGSYVSGLLPLAIPLSEARLHLVSVFGAGLLVGTALSVIVPEGVSTLYNSYVYNSASHLSQHEHQAPKTTGGTASAANHVHSATEITRDPHQLVGITLVLGFLFMLIVDKCFSQRHHSTSDAEATVKIGEGRKTNFTATLGLVVHAAADGIALGAAATTGKVETEFVVFLAIVLHKFPAAFALATFLLHEGLERPTIRRHLAVFSLAAPVMTLTTYCVINYKSQEGSNSLNSTGLALLFSAGTFLYVSTVHVLPELVSRHADPDVRNRSSEGFRRRDVLILIVGTILPMFLTLGHHH
ncbi:zinc transporter ZIP9-A-like [Ornithodoros turicata]|uniref:zinc transporter ZIP9-A-like n=1 Tax=Ornithodoros turicata TaxID=34597 RepID=UPI0031399F7B